MAYAVKAGIPMPAFSSALSYFDGYTSAKLPANLLQAQRDFFGAHTYERLDMPHGEFSTQTGQVTAAVHPQVATMHKYKSQIAILHGDQNGLHVFSL